MKKRIVLCADDYGQAPEISQAIIHLLQANRLSAVSCMVNTPYWFQHAQWLNEYCSSANIGLHFNLTHGNPLSQTYRDVQGEMFLSLPHLMRSAFFRRLSLTAIAAECHAQIDSFQQAMGFLPHFIDGHQHVHQFPVIREAVVQVYQQRLKNAYIRLVNHSLNMNAILNLKKMIIYATGTRALKRLLASHHIPHNSSFAGIYSFSKAHSYRRIFQQFLKDICSRGLIMCHPGLAAATTTEDVIADARFHEYQYLISDQFLRDCETRAICIQPFLAE